MWEGDWRTLEQVITVMDITMAWEEKWKQCFVMLEGSSVDSEKCKEYCRSMRNVGTRKMQYLCITMFRCASTWRSYGSIALNMFLAVRTIMWQAKVVFFE